MTIPVTSPVLDPSQFGDPQAQQKIAENILSQLGLHPNQQGAKSLLDSHFQGPSAVPEVKQVTQPLVSSSQPPTLAGAQPAPVADVPNPVKEETAAKPQTAIPVAKPVASVDPATSSESAVPTGGTSLRIPPPDVPSMITSNTNDQTLKAQTELKRLIDTGSGIHQIHNPFLRGLAHVGEIGADLFNPAATALIPGTENHHQMLIQQQEGLIDKGLGQSEKEATTGHTNQEILDDQNKPFNPNELGTWMEQNPGKSISDYWKQKANAQGTKLTPQESVMRYLTLPPEDGGIGMAPPDALKKVNEIVTSGKPPTGAQQQQKIEDLIARAMPNGTMDPRVMSDPNAIVDLISKSDKLTPEEKSSVFSHLAVKSTPASQGGIARLRTNSQLLSRLSPAIDTTTGSLLLVNPAMVASNPGRFIPATQGGQALSKEQAFADIDFNTRNVNDSINNLQHGFDTKTRSQFLLAMRSNDPKQAFSQFMSSEVAEGLSPDQVDYLTALASLNENAMALRSIQGLGQGSDELRAAITKMIPGPGTPTTDYAKRQMELFHGTVERARLGVPKTNIVKPDLPAPKTTAQIQQEGNAPPVGTIKHYDGKDWSFKGGDQYDQNSWEVVKKEVKK